MVWCALAAALPPAWGETAAGRLTGTVTDQVGGVIALARVSAVNTGTGFSRSARSDNSGSYTLPLLQPGSYRVTVQKEGLRPIALAGIVLRAARTTRVDFVLEVTPVFTHIEVNSGPSQVDRAGAWPSSSIVGQEVAELPASSASGRAVLDLVMLSPGLTSQAGLYSNANYSVSGGPQNTQHITVDGMRINVPGNDAWYRLRPVLEEVEEIRVESGAYQADSGGLAAISMVTQAGTNQLHGRAWGYFSGEELRARNFFQSGKPPFFNREPGGSLSGPLVRNRTFFSLMFDRFQSTKPQGAITTVPTAELREGNFRGVAALYDPATTRPSAGGSVIRNPFPGSQIPKSRMDGVALAMLEYLPTPNIPGRLSNNYNSQSIPDSALESILDTLSLRLDQRISEANQLYLRWERFSGGYRAEKTFPGYADYTGHYQNSPGYVAMADDTHCLGSGLVNELRVGVTSSGAETRYAASGKNVAAALGLKNASPLHFPTVSIGGLIPVRFGPRGSDGETTTGTRELHDALMAVRGRHMLKLGYTFRQDRLDSYSIGSPAGSFSFSGLFSNQPGEAGSGVGLADFLLGLPGSTGVSAGVPLAYRKHAHTVFFQDDMKLSRNVTLNLGLRYEVPAGVLEVNNRMSSFSPETVNPATGTAGALVYAGRDAPRRLAATDYDNVSPRLGLAWSWNSRSVVRASYSIHYYADRLSFQQGSARGFEPSLFLATTDQVTPLLKLSDGLPLLAAPVRPDGAGGNGNSAVYVPRELPAVTFYQWSLGLERELAGRVLVEAGYVGSRGSHLWMPRNINQVPTRLLGPGDAQPRRPYPQFLAINYRGSDGYSKYHALRLAASRRFARGFSFTANYTFSKTLDNTSYDSVADAAVQNVYNLRGEYALSSHDNPHVFHAAATIELPSRQGTGLLGRLTRGWQISAIAHLQAGFPFNLSTSLDQSGSLGGTLRPDRLRDGALPAGERTLQRWFDVGAFTLPDPYTFGSSGRNVLRGPGFAQMDASLARSFQLPLGKATVLQLRAESFNVLNHANFEAPAGRIGSSNAGSIAAAKDPRLITLVVRLSF